MRLQRKDVVIMSRDIVEKREKLHRNDRVIVLESDGRGATKRTEAVAVEVMRGAVRVQVGKTQRVVRYAEIELIEERYRDHAEHVLSAPAAPVPAKIADVFQLKALPLTPATIPAPAPAPVPVPTAVPLAEDEVLRSSTAWLDMGREIDGQLSVAIAKLEQEARGLDAELEAIEEKRAEVMARHLELCDRRDAMRRMSNAMKPRGS